MHLFIGPSLHLFLLVFHFFLFFGRLSNDNDQPIVLLALYHLFAPSFTDWHELIYSLLPLFSKHQEELSYQRIGQTSRTKTMKRYILLCILQRLRLLYLPLHYWLLVHIVKRHILVLYACLHCPLCVVCTMVRHICFY